MVNVKKKGKNNTFIHAQLHKYTHTFQQFCADNASICSLSLSFTLSSFELVVNESSLHLGFLSLEFRLCEEKQHSDHTHTHKKQS